jgi:ketosteroid isomerase-like protein
MIELDELRRMYRRALDAFIRGDAGPQKELWSGRDDITLANPLGPPARGHEQVWDVMDTAAAQLADGEGLEFDEVSFVETPDLAYELGIQRGRMKLGDGDRMAPVALRVTTVFRREEDGWRIVHRHADPLTVRPIAAIEQR